MILPRRRVNLSEGWLSLAKEAFLTKEIRTGEDLPRFEELFRSYLGVDHASAVFSGRTGLALILKALGIGPGDEVILQSFTFAGVPAVIKRCGAQPVFVDLSPETYQMDMDHLKRVLTGRTKAILATHLFGMPVQMEPLQEIAGEHGLFLIEDCAHGQGAEYQGRKLGTLGDFAFFSFGMGKNMPCLGGGMVVSGKNGLWERFLRDTPQMETPPMALVLAQAITTATAYQATKPVWFEGLFPWLRLYGSLRGILRMPERNGWNRFPPKGRLKTPLRMANLQARIGRHQLGRLDTINASYIQQARFLNEALRGEEGIRTPVVVPGATPIYLYYRLRVRNPQRLRVRLLRKGIDLSPEWMSACHRLDGSSQRNESFHGTEELLRQSLELPTGPAFSDGEISFLCQTLCEANR